MQYGSNNDMYGRVQCGTISTKENKKYSTAQYNTTQHTKTQQTKYVQLLCDYAIDLAWHNI